MIKIGFLSDVHAYSKAELTSGGPRPSFAEISAPENPTINPFTAVEDLIRRESLTADVLVSGGDLGDKASPQALRYAWTRVRSLQSQLGAAVLLAATGNHDMDSRAINDYDARGALQGLENYPFADSYLNNGYWANNLVVQEHDKFRSVLLNSAAYHGYQDEWQHGRISARTRKHLRDELKTTVDPGLNVLVTHHHLYPLGASNLDDQSAMKESQALIELLSGGEYGSWLILHGHRHWPSVSHAPGGQGAPVVFSGGSFSAVLYDELQGKARNQFYLLEVEENAVGHRVRGTFRAWDWISDEGFQPAREGSGLPHRGGFGSAMTGAELADQVAAFYESVGAPYLTYDKVLAAVPDLNFAMPEDLRTYTAKLEESHNLLILSTSGVPMQIGKGGSA